MEVPCRQRLLSFVGDRTVQFEQIGTVMFSDWFLPSVLGTAVTFGTGNSTLSCVDVLKFHWLLSLKENLIFQRSFTNWVIGVKARSECFTRKEGINKQGCL